MSTRLGLWGSLLLLILVLVVSETSALSANEKFHAMFQDFKAYHSKVYESLEEEAYRLSIFISNIKRARRLGLIDSHAHFSVEGNRFADLSHDEFVARYLGTRPPPRLNTGKNPIETQQSHGFGRENWNGMKKENLKDSLPSSFDWRDHGAVTEVKDQKQCGSCWAFSTTGTIEGVWAATGHPLTSLSEQELVSCDDTDQGCNGGMMGNAIEWLLNARGGRVLTESSYPYTSGDGLTEECQLEGGKVGAVVAKLVEIESNEDAIAAQLIKSGPIAVAVDASNWQLYAGGVLSSCELSALNHGVLIVGFNDTAKPPYWIIKNSWSNSWGEKGYIRIEKGSNQCGVQEYAVTVEVKDGSDSDSKNPPPPPPKPVKSELVVKSCFDNRCSLFCSKESFPLENCVDLKSGGSAIFNCSESTVEQTIFFQKKCVGASKSIKEPLNMCMGGILGYYENICTFPHAIAK
ncbi:unnamed protein product [Phytomonas sp. Hart1]|nr:unnamed protein product [Phytomonas sp. Hart1]|eukprot:CCW71869.1 unnamed protein product [Phytomonas sp. isolate Hart1]